MSLSISSICNDLFVLCMSSTMSVPLYPSPDSLCATESLAHSKTILYVTCHLMSYLCNDVIT